VKALRRIPIDHWHRRFHNFAGTAKLQLGAFIPTIPLPNQLTLLAKISKAAANRFSFFSPHPSTSRAKSANLDSSAPTHLS
jgi:hypothetical protein